MAKPKDLVTDWPLMKKIKLEGCQVVQKPAMVIPNHFNLQF